MPSQPGLVFDPFNGCCGSDTLTGCNLRKTSATTGYQQWATQKNQTITCLGLLSGGDIILGLTWADVSKGGTVKRVSGTTGDTIWTKDYLVSAVDLAIDSSDNIYVTLSGGDTLVKLNSSGVQQWRTSGQSATGQTPKYLVESGGTLYIAGTTDLWSLPASSGTGPTDIRTTAIHGGSNSFADIAFDGTDLVVANGNWVDKVTTAGVHSWGFNHGATVNVLALDSGGAVYYAANVSGGVRGRRLDTSGGSVWTNASQWDDLCVVGSVLWTVEANNINSAFPDAPADSNYVNTSYHTISNRNTADGTVSWATGGGVPGLGGTTVRVAANSTDVVTSGLCLVCYEFIRKDLTVVLEADPCGSGCTVNNPITVPVTWQGPANNYWESAGYVWFCNYQGKCRVTFSLALQQLTACFYCDASSPSPPTPVTSCGAMGLSPCGPNSGNTYHGADDPEPVSVSGSYFGLNHNTCRSCAATFGVYTTVTE